MCGATAGGPDVTGIDLTKETVIQGRVTRGDQGVAGAYVRLLDNAEEFTAEVPTSASGQFRFFASPGSWTVRALAPGGLQGERSVTAKQGVTEVELHVQA